MTDNELQNIRDNIQEEITKTEALINEYKEGAQPIAPENSIGRISRMDAINNKSITEAALKSAEIKLKNLENIKDKIEMEDFGKCIKCLNKIPIQRMLIIPESKKCVNCAN